MKHMLYFLLWSIMFKRDSLAFSAGITGEQFNKNASW